tara:strand:- start:104 stop:619 length:516 start_codon:yes stop_codon:yes gene_type:complete
MGNKQSMGVFDPPPPKPEVEPTSIEEAVDDDGKPCHIVFYKEKGFKGREFAMKINAGQKGSTSIANADMTKYGPLGGPAKSLKVKGAGCDAADFKFRGYTQPKLKGNKRVFNTKKQKNFPRPAPIRSFTLMSGVDRAERALAEAEIDPSNTDKVNAAVDATATAKVLDDGW